MLYFENVYSWKCLVIYLQMENNDKIISPKRIKLKIMKRFREIWNTIKIEIWSIIPTSPHQPSKHVKRCKDHISFSSLIPMLSQIINTFGHELIVSKLIILIYHLCLSMEEPSLIVKTRRTPSLIISALCLQTKTSILYVHSITISYSSNKWNMDNKLILTINI